MDFVLLSLDIFLREKVHNFPVDYNAINKPDILTILKHLMVKNNIKSYFNY